MEPDKKTPPETENKPPVEESKAPADALSRTPDDLEKEQADQKAANADPNAIADPTEKKLSPIKRFFRKVNVYLLIFVLIVVVAGAFTIVNYLNSQKAPVEAGIANQGLTADALKQLANTDATVGGTSQTLTIQGNTVIAGQTLMRGNLNVAGNIQIGGSFQAPNLTISGTSNLGTAQINSLQVATNTSVQGSTTLRDLNVSGTSSFGGAITASQITVTRLILSGNAVLQVPNHIAFTGPSPSRTVNGGVLGNGGSASVNGSDTTGTINVNTGNNPTAGCFTHITFQQVFTSQPHVIISPIGNAAGQTQYYADRDKDGFSVCASSPPPANQVFAYDYFVTN
jgi:cytoskeletal protein CcmA (bactofilin family)